MIRKYTNILILLCICALPACGFTPLYGTQSPGGDDVRASFDSIHIAVINDREGQALRNMLMDKLYSSGRPADPVYNLEIAPLSQKITDLDITKSADATRAQLRLDTAMVLRNNRSGEVLLERELTAITSYNVLDSRYTTRVSEQYARESALGELAEQIERNLALYFNRR